MVGIVRRVRHALAGTGPCEHHWHVVRKGWQCCACPAEHSAKAANPEPGTAACTAPPQSDPDSVTQWLADAPPTPAPRRRRRLQPTSW